jgi:hypothetical protein
MTVLPVAPLLAETIMVLRRLGERVSGGEIQLV